MSKIGYHCSIMSRKSHLFRQWGKGWVVFKYERLPNICYWCGCLNHVDRDYDLWLDSEGTLDKEHQEYGAWIRTTPFTKTKRSVVNVPGFYDTRKKGSKANGMKDGRTSMSVEAEGRSVADSQVPFFNLEKMDAVERVNANL